MASEAASGEDPPPRGRVDHLMVGGDLLIACGWTELAAGPWSARLLAGEHALELRELEIVHTAPPRGEGSGRGFLLFADVAPTLERAALSLVLADDAHELCLPCPRPGASRGLISTIAAAPADERERIRAVVERRMGKLAHGGDALPRPEHLHPRLRAHVDLAYLIPGRGVFFYGWILDPDRLLRSVHVLDSEGPGPNLLEHGARHPRPDVDRAFPELAGANGEAGLLAFAELRELDPRFGPPAVAELLFVTRAGTAASLSFPVEDPADDAHTPPGNHMAAQLERMLAPFRPEATDAYEVLDRHLGPAIEARWAARRPVAGEVREYQFGTRPRDPSCSIVVPLFARSDFLMHQLSQFARDPELADADLIYVIDDPRIRDETLRLAREVSPLWPVPFRVLDLGANLGYAAANNVGARVAEGEWVLLLNSDVLPDRPGWLGRLCEKHRHLERCGALAPRLLFEDGSIQHDGIEFVPYPGLPPLWINDHPGKGRPVAAAPPARDTVVPAVTGACMLLRRDLYLELGGLDEGYAIGDFEDSDLCLRLRERGLLNYCARGETLYHLERQSIARLGAPQWRTKLTLFNAWRHTRRWNTVLEEIARDGR